MTINQTKHMHVKSFSEEEKNVCVFFLNNNLNIAMMNQFSTDLCRSQCLGGRPFAR